MDKNRILLAIPVFNCEKQIPRVIQKISKKTVNYFDEILIIDNISNDNTVLIAKNALSNLNSNCKILINNNNVNLGGSHKVIFDYAKENNFDYVVIIHGDDQADINDFETILENKIYLKYDWIRGSRFTKGSKLFGYSKLKTIGNKFFNLLFSLILFKKIDDIGSGLDMYSIELLKKFDYYYFPDRLTFDYYMILYLTSIRVKLVFLPISWREEDQVSNVKLIKQTSELFRILFFFIFKRINITKFNHQKTNYSYKIE